jgi:hypothetical protein
MAVESQPRSTPVPLLAQPLLRNVLWGAAATLGISGAAAVVSGASAFLVYQYARARGIWGTDDQPATLLRRSRSPPSTTRSTSAAGSSPHRERRLRRPSCKVTASTGRRECLLLALRFHQAAYNVLCFDFRAHGLSGGRYTTVGHNETNDARRGRLPDAAARSRPRTHRRGRLSMGGAAGIQAAARCPNIAAVVADSSYSAFLDAARYSFHVVTRLPHAVWRRSPAMAK